MELDKIKTQMRKGALELCTLAVISKGACYPADIIRIFKDQSINIPEGTLYPVLTRLKNGSHLKYKWVESTEGPPRKYFSITPKGKKYYSQLCTVWNQLSSSIKTIIEQTIL